VRLGGGSIRSFVSAYMTLKGLFCLWRASVLDPVAIDLAAFGMKDQSLATLLARVTGLGAAAMLAASAGVCAPGLLVFALADRRFRSNPWRVVGATALGALVVLAWYLTGHLGHGENPQTLETIYFATATHTIESLSFVAPSPIRSSC
jgi:uncharacterized protein